MSRTRLLVSLLLVCLALTPGAARVLERVSVATDGTQGTGDSYDSAISADGRYVVFRSWASLVPGGTGWCDIFVRDRSTGLTERVSVASDGTPANGDSHWPAISGDGRYVAFSSAASNLVPGDTGYRDIFVHDRSTGVTERVSVASDGTPANADSDHPSISLDGRYVIFQSDANNLVPNDTNQTTDVFLRDRTLGTTERLSVASNGTQGNAASYLPELATAISADGRYVVFESEASNLVAGDTNGQRDIFLRDRLANTTTRIMGTGGVQPQGESCEASISASGRYIVFRSWANNLVPSDPNWYEDIFLYDRITQAMELESVGSDYGSARPYVSTDGRYVTFSSWSNSIVPGDTGYWDVFVRDRQSGVIARLDVNAAYQQANGDADRPAISADGRFVAFQSGASNLIPDDTNQVCDVFVATTSPATPVAPSGLTATATCDVKVSLSWVNNWDSQTLIEVERKTGADGAWAKIAQLSADATTYRDCGLTPATTYYYRVRAGNPFCFASYSNEASVTTQNPWNVESVCWRVSYGNNWSRSGWVQVPGASEIRLHFSTIDVEHLTKWDELWSNADDYWSGFYTDISSNEKAGNTITLYLQSDDSVTGYFVIDRVEWRGTATGPAAFGGDLFSGALVLAAPTGLGALVPSPCHVDLSWTDNATNETGYRVERRLGLAGTWSQIGTTAANATAYEDASAPAGKVYYRVAAYNADGAAYSPALMVRVNTFSDVPGTSSLWPYVEAVVREGISGGCSTSPPLYCPGSPVTRGQMAVFLCRAAGLAPYDNPIPTFSDVPRSHSQYSYIEALYRAGVTSGCATGPLRYCPTSPVTRGQMAVFMCRAAGIAPYNNPTPTFTDVLPGTSQYAYVEALCRAGVTSGCSTSPPRYCPLSSITRGQMAVFLCRAFGIPVE